MLTRVPVWAWWLFIHTSSKVELRTLNIDPIADVRHWHDIDFVGDDIRSHRLDVMAPPNTSSAQARQTLPVYVYYHGGGWTPGDKASLTKYCAGQSANGIGVVTVTYRMAPHFHLGHVLEDANAALDWVDDHIGDFSGDRERIVLGGDSDGGQISALMAAATVRAELAEYYQLDPALHPKQLRGLVQHRSIVDFSVFFDKGFVMSLNFIRMLLPPVFITTSERDFSYDSNIIKALSEHGVPVDSLAYSRGDSNTQHTWQRNFRYPESQEVYRHLESFKTRVTVPA